MTPAAVLLVLSLLSPSCRADDAPLSLAGGAASLLSPSQTSIRMAAETVIVALGRELYSVDAEFESSNAGPSTTVPVGFPLLADKTYGYAGDPLYNFRTWVDGKEMKADSIADRRKKKATSWLVARIAFPGNAATRVRVRYDAEYREGAAEYYFGTGAAWRGTIGRALFVVKPEAELGYEKLAVSGIGGAKARRLRLGPSAEGILVEDFKPGPDGRFVVSGARELWAAAGLQACELGYGDVETCSDINYHSWKHVTEPVPRGLLDGLSLEGLRLLRNAFFAGHGRVFKDARLNETFARRAWYHPDSGFDLAGLGAVEKRNVDLIAAAEEARKKLPADGGGLVDAERLAEAGLSLRMLEAFAAASGRDSGRDEDEDRIVAMLQRALEDGAPVDGRGASGYTALMRAARTGLPKVAGWLLDHGASLEVESEAGETALSEACDSIGMNAGQRRRMLQGRHQVVALLLDRGASVHPEKGKASALAAAAGSGDRELVEYLLKRGAGGRDELARALGAAMHQDQPEMASWLVARGALEGQLPEKSRYLLQQAAWGGMTDIIEEIVKHGGVDVNAVWTANGYEDPPLVIAAQRNQAPAVALLLDSGAKVDARGAGGETALMRAASACHQDVVELLLKSGADRRLKDSSGKTAFEHATCGEVKTRLMVLPPRP